MEKELTRAFFRWWGYPSIEIPRSYEEGTSLQRSFIDQTINSFIYRKYPIPKNKATNFVKRFVLALENSGEVEVLPELYDFILKRELIDGQYRTYWPKHLPQHLTLIEDQNLITSGTTGLRTWPAALALSDYITAQDKSLIRDKIVMELGSGTGYLGLSLAKTKLPQQVILTDCHPEVISTLKSNSSINGDIATVKELNWSESAGPSMEEPHLIVASDVVFDPSILKALCSTLSSLMNRGGEAYIACTERNEATLNEFELELEIVGLSKKIIERCGDKNYQVDRDPQLPIRIYHIQKK